MYWLDVTILVLLGLGAGLGFWSGLLWQVARVLSLGLALYATILFNDPATAFLEEVTRGVDPHVARGVAYIGVFLGIYLGLFLFTRLLHMTIRATQLEMLDRLLGGLLGAAKMSLLVALACTGLAALATPTTEEWLAHSTLAPLFAHATEVGLERIPEDYRGHVRDAMQQLHDMLPPRLEATAAAAPLTDEPAAQ
jgi:uncharacterized membrane protein required for colicin V production